MSQTKKKSLIRSSLISTGGFFIAKMLGLVYTIPLSAILVSDAYQSYYGTAYRIYSYILQVFTAGFPMAVATLVATYSTLEDPKSVLKVRKIAIIFLAVTGFLGMLLMMAVAGLFSSVIAGQADAPIMRNVLMILSVAIFLVPVLSAYRGYCQGLDEMKEYAYSQTFEQIFRVAFLLGLACLLVYGLGMDRVWALYAAVGSTSVAALAGLFQIARFSSKRDLALQQEAKTQKTAAVDTNTMFREFVTLAIPYLIVAILGYIDDPINSILLPFGLNHSGLDTDQVNVVLNAVNYGGTKLTAIPMILAPGFTAALIPHISSALAASDFRQVRANIKDILSIVLYIAGPVSFCIFLYARPLYYILFYSEDLALAGHTIRWIALEGFTGTILPVITTTMMALRLRKTVLKGLLVYSIIKLVLTVPMVMWLGFPGAVLCSLLGGAYLAWNNLSAMGHKYRVNFKPVAREALFILCGLACMWISCTLLELAGLRADTGSKLFCLVQLAINGTLTVLVYAAFTWAFGIPQSIFHLKGKAAHV